MKEKAKKEARRFSPSREYSKNIKFTLSDCGKYYTVSGFEGEATSWLSIPPTYKKKPISRLGRLAFCGLENLRSLFFSENISDIAESAFSECTGIEAIEVEEGNSVYHSEGSCLIDTESKTLILGCKSSIIPSDGSVRIIDQYAFRQCTGLKELKIPEGISEIRNNAFYGCLELESISADRENEVYYSIDNCLIEKKCKVLVLGCKNSKIPADGRAKIIGTSAFAGCSGLKSLDIPSCITAISMDAFYNCSELAGISIPFSVVTISGGAFYGCEGLKSITYGGTKSEWAELKKGKYWDHGIPEYTVFCTDGSIHIKKD